MANYQLGLSYEGAFLNFIKSYQAQSYAPGSSPADLDANYYPKNALGGTISGSILMPPSYAPNGVSFVLKNTGTRQVRCSIGANVTITSSSGLVTTTGGSVSNMVATFTGAGKVFFTFNDYASTEFGFTFPTGFTNVTGTGELALVRASDEAGYDAGEYHTAEYLALARDLNPTTIRPMGENQQFGQGSNQSIWGYRTTPTSVSWLTEKYPAGAWGGIVTTADNIAYTCSNATDSNPAVYVHGEIIQVQWANAGNANTVPTLKRGTLLPIGIVTSTVAAIGVGAITANSLNTFYYDSILIKWVRFAGGVTFNVPVEVMVQRANRLNANLHFVMPFLANDSYFTSCTTLIRDSLTRTAYFELGNEVWNLGFFSVYIAYYRGLALGFPDGSNRPQSTWYGLRVRQMMGIITPLWAATRSATTLKRVMASSAVPGFVADYQTYQLNGFLLVGATYPAYLAWVGGVDPGYNVAGNRAIDYCDVIAFAPYCQGSNVAEVDSNYQAASAADLQTAARNFALGGAGAATALAWLDGDIRGTTHGAVVLSFETLLGYRQAGGPYPLWEAVAASYDSGRAIALTVEAYEMALQCAAPSEAECTTLGITADYLGSTLTAAGASAALAALILAWKNHASYGHNFVIDCFTQFMAFPHFKAPCWLQTTGPNEWSLLPGDIFSTPYQTYYGVKNYSNGARRLRAKTG